MVVAGHARAVFRGTASVLSTYTDHVVRSPSVEIELPSVIVLKTYVQQNRKGQQAPAFTRRNLFVRDGFSCQYCRQKFQTHELTYDHVVPRAKQGGTSWTNVVTACKHCNARKGHRLLKNIPDMDLAVRAEGADVGRAPAPRAPVPAAPRPRGLVGLRLRGGEMGRGSAVALSVDLRVPF